MPDAVISIDVRNPSLMRTDAEGAPEIFQYFFRRTPENNASRASPPQFIGRRRTDFRFGRAYLGWLGLRIMNPPL
jgi:hypothetical protein